MRRLRPRLEFAANHRQFYNHYRAVIAYGAALITAVAAGLLDPEPAALRTLIQLDAHLEPNPQHRTFYDDLFKIYQAADHSLVDIAHRLTEFERIGIERLT